jgi:hypothetical protein
MSVIDSFQDQSSETFETVEHMHTHIYILLGGGDGRVRVEKIK